MFKKIISILLIGSLLPVSLFAQSKPDVLTFDRSLFDYYFSRADREINPERWMSEARQGAEIAINAWELFAFELYDNPLLFSEAKNKLTEWSDSEIEERYLQWLCNRFFGSVVENSIKQISLNLSDIHKSYIYHLDDNGNIVYNENTSDPSIIRPGELNRDFVDDLRKWQAETSGLMADEILEFDNSLSRLFPELLLYISEFEDEVFNEKLHNIAISAKNAIKMEFEKTVAREERIFTNLRTGDLWSLRKKSETEAASKIIEKLISEAEEYCNTGINSLSEQIEAAYADNSDLSLMGNNWLELYRQQFEYGLKKWEEAEEKFFIRRMEWEQDAIRIFSESEEVWLQAYIQFEDKRKEWELQIKTLFESGEAIFKNASENLEKAIYEAKVEFEYNLQLRVEAGTTRMKALVDMYLICLSGINIATENAEILLKQFGMDYRPDLSDNEFEEWAYNERINILQMSVKIYKSKLNYLSDNNRLLISKLALELATDDEAKKNLEINYQNQLNEFNTKHKLLFLMEEMISSKLNSGDELFMINELKKLRYSNYIKYNSLLEIQRAINSYKSYVIKAEELKSQIMTDYNALFGYGLLNEILSENVNSENFFLDEYQITLIRAKAVALYWERQMEIAQAVSNYANETYSGRMTDAEGILAWEAAKSDYEKALALYEEEFRKLNSLNGDIANQQKKLNDLSKELNKIEQGLNQSNSEYSLLISSHIENRDDFLKKEFESKYLEFVNTHQQLIRPDTNIMYNAYINSLADLCLAEHSDTAIELYNLLIFGDDEGFESLDELIEAVNNIPLLLNKEQLPRDINEFGFSPDDPRYIMLNYLIDEKNKLMELAVAEGNDSSVIEEQYNSLIFTLYSSYRSEAEANLYIRQTGLALFSDFPYTELRTDQNYSGIDWYIYVKNIELSDDEKESFSNIILIDRLKEDLNNSTRILLEKRLTLEIAALDYLANGNKESDCPFLSKFFIFDANFAKTGLNALLYIHEKLIQGEDYNDCDNEEMNEIIRWFISGGSFFSISEVFIIKETRDYYISRGLFDLYYNFYTLSSFGISTVWEETVNGLQSLYENYNINSDNRSLPEIRSICESLILLSGDFIVNVSAFLFEFDQIISLLPNMIKDEIETWKRILIENISISAINHGIISSKTINEMEFEQLKINERYIEFYKIYDSIIFFDESTLMQLNKIYWEILDDEKMLSYQFSIFGGYTDLITEIEKNENKKHWRQFLNMENISEIDEEFPLIVTWLEGKINDINDQTDIYDNFINDILITFSSTSINRNSIDEAKVVYNKALNDWQSFIFNYNYLYLGLNNIANGLNYLSMDSEQYYSQQVRLEDLLNEQKILFDAIQEEYLIAANDYYNAGRNYNLQYDVVKNSFNDMEDYRFKLEIQDTIRRWASTSYLDHEIIDMVKCTENFERSKIVLEVLTNLYIDEERRPYDNPVYEKLYHEYEESFARMLRIYKVRSIINSAIAEEQSNNNRIYNSFISSINELGFIKTIPDNYSSPDDTKEWTIIDIITVNNGNLSFSKDSDGKVYAANNEDSFALQDYFSQNIHLYNEIHTFSQFEIALYNLAVRMNEYFTDPNRIEIWGYARNYLLREIIKNSNITFLKDNLKNASQLRNGQSLGNMKYIIYPLIPKESVGDYINEIQSKIRQIEKGAWDKLSDSERADLELYLIITMSGDSNNYYSAFSEYVTLYEYQDTFKRVNELYKVAESKSKNYWNPFFFIFLEMRDVNKTILGRIKTPLDNTQNTINTFENDLLNTISKIMALEKEYKNSCEYLSELYGYKDTEQYISWNEIKNTLAETGKFKNEEIDLIENDWLKMIADTGNKFHTNIEAIAGITQWVENNRENSRQLLENQFITDYRNQQNKIAEYYNITENFVNDKLDNEILVNVLNAAFGNKTPSLRNHLENIGNTQLNDIFDLISIDKINLIDPSILINNFISLYTQIIFNKYNTELTARQIDWDIQRLDIYNKYEEWQQTISMIIERGTNDWKDGMQKLNNAYKRWTENFQSEYNEINDSWAQAYLAGLMDKENWLVQVETAAQQASSETLLKLIGAEAERMTRIMDTRDQLITLNNNSTEDAKAVIDELLNMPGLNLDNAFNMLKGFSSLSSIHINSSMYYNYMDTNIIKTIAGDFAKKVNSELTSLEARKFVNKIQDSIDDAIRGIDNNIMDANMNFRRKMDDLFILNGQWRKSGNKYIKDVIVNSTLFESVIFETVSVPEFTDFKIEPIKLKNSISNYNLEILDSYAIMNLMDNIFGEINNIVEEIFGLNEDGTIIKSAFEEIYYTFEYYTTKTDDGKPRTHRKTIVNTKIVDYDDRFQNPGKFGKHIGYEPAVKDIKGKISNKNELLYDQGSGELGRLLSDYYYWAVIDGIGVSQLSMAAWDKPLWDDRNSIFEAPSLRSTIEVANAVGAAVVSVVLAPYTGGASIFGFMALMAGINTTDDLVFSALDYSYGYKTIDEALFDVGKASVINLTSSFVSGAFGGVANVAGNSFLAAGNGLSGLALQTTTDSISKVVIGAAMTGAQTFTTGLITSGLNGITYDHDNRWGYSMDIFNEGIRGTVINTFSSFASSLTSGMLTHINSGINYDKLHGFNPGNIQNLGKLNNLLGSLAGQGVQYALGGDFTLNLFNTSLFTNGNIDVGLLEMRLNSGNQHLFGIGTAGVNFSPDNIMQSIQGANVWNLNNRITKYTNNHEFKEMVSLRALFGYGDRQITNQLYDILNDTTEIIIGNENGYNALTDRVDGKRIVYLNDYQAGMSYEDQLRLAITLGHEAYRDGIITGDNYLETRTAVTAHTMMAAKMLNDGYLFTLDYNIINDLNTYFNSTGNFDIFNSYVDNYYDSSGDYWKLKKNGSLEFDGFATLTDEEGNVILSLDAMGLKKETQIESALLYMLNVNPNDKEKVNAVRQMMVNAGLQHTSDPNPNNWFWTGYESYLSSKEGELWSIYGLRDIKNENMGVQIGVDAIANLYTSTGMSGSKIVESINRIYGSAINFFNYANTGLKSDIAASIINFALPAIEAELILANVDYYNYYITNGINTDSMVSGNPRRTSEFDVTYSDLELVKKDPTIKEFFEEDHTGIDYGRGGTGVTIPEGYWQIIQIDNHRIYLQLLGSDLKLRIMHLNPAELEKLAKGSIFGGSNPLEIKYPTEVYGTGTGPHIHIDMTMNLPYNNEYTWQFVNPANLLPGSRLNYYYGTKDANNNYLPDSRKSFNRRWIF